MTEKSEDPFNEKETQVLKAYYQALDQQLGIEPTTPEFLRLRFEEKLADRVRKKEQHFNWKVFLTTLFGAFGLGLMVARFWLGPELATTRGLSPEPQLGSSINASPKVITLDLPDPVGFMSDLIESGKDSGLEFDIIHTRQGVQVFVKPFVANDARQEWVRTLLGLDPGTQGAVTVILPKKPR